MILHVCWMLCVWLDAEILRKIQFVVMGDGPQKQKFQEKSLGLPVIFTGRLSYPEMVWILSHCDIAVNPIVKGAAQSIINKHMDYAMAGLPVINTQECQEYRDLLVKYNAGINCECANIEELARAIDLLVRTPELRKDLGKNSLRLGEELFDRARTYRQILKLF